MATFPVTHFLHSVRYPESGQRMQLGRSYMHTSDDPAPDQRLFTLTLTGMQFFCDDNGDLDDSQEVPRNMLVLEDFYLEHKLHKSFDFDHPFYGTLLCKFNKPLEIPEGIPGGDGILEEIKIELIEIP